MPIQLKFFKKLELYQELKFQNKKAKKADKDHWKIWNTEKEILRWTPWNHHFLNSVIGHDYVRRKILKQNEAGASEIETKYDYELTRTFGNLVKRGYAEKEKDTNIYFTREGLLMGEVINDYHSIESYKDVKNLSKLWKKTKYPFFIFFTWTTIFIGALTIIVKFLEPILIYLYNLLSCIISP